VQDDFFDDTIIPDSHPGFSAAPTELDFADTIIVGSDASSGPKSVVEPLPRTHSEADAPTEPGTLLHYHLRIGATVVGLDKVAYIGRKPSAPRVMLDGVPRLIQVPSPRKEVSGTHLEVRQRGANVVLTDLRSTNGSLINIPGRSPRKLCRGESLVVTAGTLVDIGDGNLVEILPMQRV
jgi:pSer/pThr/pTyr-binding forkhead associated (FHA) protein